MESEFGAELLKVVAAIVTAFQTAADTLEVIKERKEKRKRKRDKEMEELMEMKILHRSLSENASRVRQHSESRRQQYSPAFEAGDAIALPTLKDVVITLQTEVIQALLLARAVENAVLDLTALLESSVTSCKDATRAMDQLCQRIMASMQYQSQTLHDRQSWVPSNFSIRSGYTGVQPYGCNESLHFRSFSEPEAETVLHGTSDPTMDNIRMGRHLSQRHMPQRAFTLRHTSQVASQRSIFRVAPPESASSILQADPPHSQMSPRNSIASNNSASKSSGSQLDPSRPSSSHASSSRPSSIGDFQPSGQSTLRRIDTQRSAFSIQPSIFAVGARETQPSTPASATSVLAFRDARRGSLREQALAEPQLVFGIQESKLSSVVEAVAVDPGDEVTMKPIRVLPTSPPETTFTIDAGSVIEVCVPHAQDQKPSVDLSIYGDGYRPDVGDVVQAYPSSDLARIETYHQILPEQTTDPEVTPVAIPFAQVEKGLDDMKADIVSIVSQDTDATDTEVVCLSPRIEIVDPLSPGPRAPEAVRCDPDTQFTEKIRPMPDLFNEKFRAAFTQADYQDRLLALPKGQANVWQPLARPAMHNRYHGFCRGAWQIRRAPDEGIHVQLTESAKEPILHWQCTACNFRSKAPNADALPDYIQFNQKHNIRFRWYFLAKSHRTAEKSCDNPDNYQYGCVFCAAQGHTTAVHEKLEHLFVHILAKHKTTMITPEVKSKTRCIVGSLAGQSKDWDINLPENNVKGPGTAADELLITAGKFWNRRKGKK